MASSAQVGRGIGSVLGLAFGLREGGRRRKNRLKAKADLDEKQLQQLRDEQLRKARTGLLGEGILAPEQKQRVLSEIGIAPTTEQNIFRDINREGFAQGSDEEKIFREEMARREKLKLFERFGIAKDVLRKGAETGGVEADTIPGLGRTPGDIAKVGLTKAQTKTQESIQDVNEARVKSFNALELKRKRVESARSSGKKSEQMSALRTLQSGFVTRIKSLDRIIEFDPFDVEEGTNTARQERASLLEELLGVTKELRTIGGVKETKIPKRINQSDITKMSTKELKDELIKSLTEK